MIDQLKLGIDVVHCNDWQAGLLPSFLAHGIQGSWRGHRERTIFTIHNLGYQGIFSGNDYSMTNLPFSCFSVETMEFYGNINCVKNGITASDLVTTVSPTYAQEIQKTENGFGLHGVLASAKGRLVGILNGIDAEERDPATDRGIAKNFSAQDLAGKAACRKALLAAAGLQVKPTSPVLGVVTRLTEQKGMELLGASMPALMERDLGIVLLGRGDAKIEEECRSWATRWPGKVAVKVAYDPDFARVLCAGADLLLMPSRYEPCGLQQLYAMRYGTVPIVHAVGGLADTVVDVASTQPRGYGFTFAEFTSAALTSCIERALELFRRPEAWVPLQKRCMQQDFAWPRFAKEYKAVYERALSLPKKA
jgi:starch synthase